MYTSETCSMKSLHGLVKTQNPQQTVKVVSFISFIVGKPTELETKTPEVYPATEPDFEMTARISRSFERMGSDPSDSADSVLAARPHIVYRAPRIVCRMAVWDKQFVPLECNTASSGGFRSSPES